MIKKNYFALDIMKFVASIFVVYMHTTPLKDVNDVMDFIFFSISRIAVPFFLVTSGFLFFRKVKKLELYDQTLFKYIKRLFKLYLAWSILMLPLSIMDLKSKGFVTAFITYIRNFIFLGSYFQLWYYPALITGIVLVFYLYKKNSIKKILIISGLVYILGLLGNSYNILTYNNSVISSIWNKYYSIFVTTRNGFFYAFIFIAIGLFISKNKIEINKRTNVILLIISTISLIIESFILRSNGASKNFDMCIMLIPTSILLVNLLINIELTEIPLYKILRDSSVIIFGVHKFFIVILSKVDFLHVREGLVFIFTIIFSFLFTIIILELEHKKNITLLKYLH